ncbi:RNA-guided endonuclease IscB, partial [Psychromonas aquimarina]|uniref:RNA-guided endonuclease IscB n=1 Tax=Psychromonas aquimarina TaxID=444919 RepID=UPI00055D7E66
MPCKPAVARLLLKDRKAKVKTRMPFTIKLVGETTEYKQPIVGGMDTGSKFVGCAVTANGEVIYQSEVKLRTDVSKKMKQRAMYRRTRRGRKCRYRPARWANRASMRATGRLAPSIRSKVESHLREKKQVESILPIRQWKVETASFDIHRITDPYVIRSGYQQGVQKDFYNVKAYVLHRDNYTCQSDRKCMHSTKLHVHHLVFRSHGGSDAPSNLKTLCEACHNDLHAGKFELKAKKSKTKYATEIGVVKAQLKNFWDFEETFGFETKFKREVFLALPKTHCNDAVAICCEDGELVHSASHVFYKRHVANGDYQQRKGIRSEKRIPVGKLFGLKKHDYVKTPQGTGFVKGKRSTGYFALENILGEKVHASANIKKNTVRLTARTTTLTQLMESASNSPSTKAGGTLAQY